MSTTEQITAEQIHALIAERIEGWTEVYIGLGTPPGIIKGRYTKVPNYSADLNLCARAEARVAEMEHGLLYLSRLHEQIALLQWPDMPSEVRNNLYDRGLLCPVRVATAPASARVRALYAVAQQIGDQP